MKRRKLVGAAAKTWHVALPEQIDFVRHVKTQLNQGTLEVAPLPQVVVELTKLANSSNASLKHASKVVARDAQLAGRVLRMASSPAFGGRKAADLRQATVRLGMTGLRDIAFSLTMGSMFRGGPLQPLMTEQLRHAYIVACGTLHLCRLARADLDQGFLAGLLHDVGKLVLIEMIVKHGQPTEPSEIQAVLSEFHCDVGALVAAAWQLPAVVRQVTQYHHRPDAAKEHQWICGAVATANCAAHTEGTDLESRVFTCLQQPELKRHLPLEEAHIRSLAEAIQRAAEDPALNQLIG